MLQMALRSWLKHGCRIVWSIFYITGADLSKNNYSSKQSMVSSVAIVIGTRI